MIALYDGVRPLLFLCKYKYFFINPFCYNFTKRRTISAMTVFPTVKCSVAREF